MAITLFIPIVLLTISSGNGQINPISHHGSAWIAIGKLHTTGAFAHLHLEYPLDELKRRLTFLDSVNKRFQVVTVPKTIPAHNKKDAETRLRFLKRFVNDTLTEIQMKMTGITNSQDLDWTSKPPVQLRKKRQIMLGVAAIAGAISGALSSQFTQDTVNNVIGRTQKVISQTVSRNLVHIHDAERDIKLLNKTIAKLKRDFELDFSNGQRTMYDGILVRTTYAVDLVARGIRNAIHTIVMARHGILDPETIDLPNFIQGIEQLNRLAIQHGFELAIKDPAEMRSLDTSYLFNKTSDTVHLIVHVPIFHPGEGMSLYRYMQVPIPFKLDPEGTLMTYLEIEPQEHYLALSSDLTSYTTLNDADFATCQRQGKAFYCPSAVKFKKNRPDCLMSLFDASTKDIRANCPVFISTHVSKAERISEEEWLITESRRQRVTIVCPGQGRQQQEFVGSIRVSLGSGCRLNTEYIALHRPLFEADVVVSGLVNNSDTSPHVFIQEELRQPLRSVAQHLLSQVGQKTPLDQIESLARFQHQLNTIKLTSWSFDWRGFVFGSMLPSIGMIIGIILGYLLVKNLLPYCCRRLLSTTNKTDQKPSSVELPELDSEAPLLRRQLHAARPKRYKLDHTSVTYHAGADTATCLPAGSGAA